MRIASWHIRYGNLIASPFPLETDDSDWAPGLPWKQALARAKRSSTGEWTAPGQLRGACGRSFARQRWVDAVRAVLGEAPSVDLVHTARRVGGPAAWHTTHEIRGKARYFDHILVSSHWDIQGVGFNHDVRTDGTSEHSLVWADI